MLSRVMRSTRVGPAILFVVISMWVWFSDMEHKVLYVVANAAVIVVTVLVLERMRARRT
jgi:hypothetical protein